MTVPQPSTSTLRTVVTTFAGVAVISTIFRICYRLKIRRFWWDDGWAAMSVAAQFVLLVNLWIRTDTPDVGPLHQSKGNRIIAYWLVSLSFTFTLWSARMSQLFSVVRIIPEIMRMRKIAYGIAGLFGAMWTTLIIQKVYICKRDTSWYREAKPQCHLGHAVASTELATDFISDAMLVVVPLRLLWRVSMHRSQRKLLFSVFSASILTTIVSAVHAYFVLGPSGLLEATTANVEASVSLIVANLAVIVTYLYRLIRGERDLENTVYISDGSSSRSLSFAMKRVTGSNKKTSTQGGQISALRFGKDPDAEDDLDDGFVKSIHPLDNAPHVFITQETFMSRDSGDVKISPKPL
ncbi:hypothetical protein NEOLEDRAFT_1176601 [Neolentinus lepideus HHB14362 ss-1]|uniref:Rhodopsin domain-containing protein n=1 Tax=Neolentinus lepideus HHB14362 ss-1 TaxID=1314782 RepID=A0A165U3H5_9AGAM|nr:hypothetical protein NEOLEDRAFT_1176601 [Neolentinus lepideus HHB14362 ss-1]